MLVVEECLGRQKYLVDPSANFHVCLPILVLAYSPIKHIVTMGELTALFLERLSAAGCFGASSLCQGCRGGGPSGPGFGVSSNGGHAFGGPLRERELFLGCLLTGHADGSGVP